MPFLSQLYLIEGLYLSIHPLTAESKFWIRINSIHTSDLSNLGENKLSFEYYFHGGWNKKINYLTLSAIPCFKSYILCQGILTCKGTRTMMTRHTGHSCKEDFAEVKSYASDKKNNIMQNLLMLL